MFRKNVVKKDKVSVFKYRFGDDLTFERDLLDLEENRFYAPNYERLNDPCETFVQSGIINSQIDWFSRRIGRPIDTVKQSLQEMINRKNNVGIYSLSQNVRDELLWAHYANSHQGFCIEYDLKTLLITDKNDSPLYSFPVKYNRIPPQISLKDITKNDLLSIVRKIAGTKSNKWSYEQEYRIVLDNNGHRTYNHKALKAIYFGIRMSDEKKLEIMSRLQGRGISYFQVYLESSSYRLKAYSEQDIFDNSLTYLNEIPVTVTGSLPIKYEILERNYFWTYRKAKITIELEKKTDEQSIHWLGNQIRKHLFSHADRIFMFYNIKGTNNHGACWASSHFENGNMKVVINDFSWLNEETIVNGKPVETYE